MDVLQELNRISEYGYISFDDLTVGKPYKVESFGTYTSNKYTKGQKNVTVNIEMGYLILPERFSEMINKIDKLIMENLHIIFLGRGTDGKKLNIRFESIKESISQQQ